MKNKNWRWRYVFFICITLYLVAIIFSVLIINNVPSSYVRIQKQENNKIDKVIKEAVELNNKQDYQKILDNYLVDFVVYNESNKQIEYSSINLNGDISLLDKNVNDNLVSSKDEYKLVRGNDEISIWTIKYYISPQQTFDVWIITLEIIVSILLSIITLALVLLFFKYVRPLERLKITIQNMSAFQLNEIKNVSKSSEYDVLTSELSDFSSKLDKKIKDTSYKYSELERNIILQNESMNYRNIMLASLAHDLKAPLSLVNLNLEQMKTSKDLSNINNIQNKVEQIMIDINNINKVAHSEEMIHIEAQEFDLIEQLLNVYKEYKSLFESRGFYTDFELENSLKIVKNKVRVKQLIDNILSNIYYHADENADVEISCWQENNDVYLTFYNDAVEIKTEDLSKLTNLFYTKSVNEYGSGIGLYTINNIVKELNGQLILEKAKKGLFIKVVIPSE
ncbi:signal transduction histidine kinase [Bacilli bacterium PM5-3]|nr:signal transduction histidine kinase [Bacilli bacterium PM5-3]MDH6604010.1 signal transduction histidine kinase [Bacilli bacterium PM5-9]